MVASNSAKHRMDRIIRLHEEIDQIKKDIRDIYAEEKAEGGDKTAMGEAITKIRKREKDKTAFDERENMVDVYLMAYSAPSRTHTHAREDRSDAGLSILTKHEDIRTSDGSPSVSSSPAESEAEEISASNPAGSSSGKASDFGSEDAGSIPAPASSSDQPLAGGDHEVASSAERERETVTSNTGEGAACALPAKSKLRPHCQRPGNTCGGYGDKHCHDCLRAMREYEAA